jgi:CHAT domain-containing protein/Tfp pilus assembly protein PilF
LTKGLPALALACLAVVGAPAAAVARSPPACAVLESPLGPSSPAPEVAHALAQLEECLRGLRASGENPSGAGRHREAEALATLAELRGLEGNWDASLVAAEQAGAAARAAGDVGLASRADTARGDALFYLWRFEDAVAAFEGALAGVTVLGDRHAEAMQLKNIGIAQAALGRRDLALVRLEEALERQPAGDDDGLGVSVLGNLGTIYARLGAPRSARRAYLGALELARKSGRPSEVSDVLGRLGHLGLELDRWEEARRFFLDALAEAERAGPTAALPLLEGAAYADEKTGHEEDAEEKLERLLAAHRRLGNVPATCLALADLAAFRERHRPELALDTYREAESLGERAGARCRWEALAGHGRLAQKEGDRDLAIEKYLLAIADVEERWRRAVSDFDRMGLASAAEPTFRGLVELLVERGEARGDRADLELAFAVLERGRAPGLTRAIAEARLPAAPSIRGLEEQIRTLERRIESPGDGDADRDELEDVLAQREAQLDEHLRNARRAAGRRAELRPLAAAEASRLLPPATALVSYLVGENGSLAFVVTGDGLRVVRLPARRVALAEQVEGFVDLLREPGWRGWAPVGHRLYRDLVAPWLEDLEPGIDTLVIVPDPALGSLPFEALPRERDGSRPLVEELAIAYAPSATALAELGSEQPATRPAMLVLAGPGGAAAPVGAEAPARRLRALYEEDGHELSPLPFGEEEARRVAALAGASGRYLSPPQATEAWMKSRAPERATVLHFATHGLLSPGDPRRSALLLAADAAGREDGFLQAREIEHLHLPADLVVLSACRTARRQPLGGQAVQSLAEAFFSAGARSVVGTLWEVDDRAAMQLMTAFYRHLARGSDKAQALRLAKLDVLGRGAAPRDWAGFVLLGEPAGRVSLGGGTQIGAARPALGALAALALAVAGGWALRRQRGRHRSAM